MARGFGGFFGGGFLGAVWDGPDMGTAYPDRINPRHVFGEGPLNKWGYML